MLGRYVQSELKGWRTRQLTFHNPVHLTLDE